MKPYLYVLTLTVTALLAGCSAPAATPTAVVPSVVPAQTVQAAQPTSAPISQPTVQPTTAPTLAPPTAQPAETTVPTVVAPPLARTLSRQQPAVQGEDVQALQTRLLQLGYLQLGEADGIFGANTETAVRAFQTLNKLVVDGVVGPDTWAALYTPQVVAFDLHPIVDTQQGYLIGASNGAIWVEAEQAALILGEANYRLLDQNTSSAASVVRGSAPRTPENDPCVYTHFVEFGAPVAADRPIALAADWNPLPQPVTEVPTDTTELQAPVAASLRVLGLAQPQIRITRALRADLDNDGNEETILAATYRASGLDFPQPSAKTGDYSGVFVLRSNTQEATVVASDVVTKDIEFGAPSEFRLLGLWDLNGDGTLEIAAAANYYEGASTIIYTFSASATQEALATGCGV